MPLIRVSDGDVLTVTGSGTVTRDGSVDVWHVHDGAPLYLGSGLYNLAGSVRHSVKSGTVAALEARLPRVTETIKSARIIAAALTEQRTRPMALKDKAQHFAERLKGVPGRIEAGLDALLEEVTAMEADAADSLTRGAKVVADARASVAVVKDIVNQLDNGGE